ncbi:inorganic pyrophosphatase [Heterostelium album PN500]|uniref:inorganic diphosphatase n=1 Tax=Heterostelium pallidum (strain ATCC 26659 / Pp 5 / PN500) TaxID=670386 RepID=D3BL07_HETP5|nr:inorganic pyrophosphatase [Heterostelium album PN500]EFA78587.1 inorganic pyrophosphatase [Heterostelium album PN500]|eukprot:XP_020430711.1 inorganic pyrophosphatase [Heterostelium album PN500]
MFIRRSSIKLFNSSLISQSIRLDLNKHVRFYSSKLNITFKEVGAEGTFDYRVKYFKEDSGDQISPWHEIPLVNKSSSTENTIVYNYINEMPKNSNAKMEVNTKELYNPIKQDIKKGQLRYIKHGNLLFNYGCLPQTWENPKLADHLTGLMGDNDPVDVVEVGSRVIARGQVKQVKVLGALALIDEGETDWKVLAIDIEDPNANKINTLEDLEKLQPGTVEKVRHWYKVYKVAEGKGENEYALNGQPIDIKQTQSVISETHHYWKDLIGENYKFKLE